MKLSVVIPNLNKEKYLAKCLDSIYKQTYKDYEVILVDGGSTDNTFEILKDYPEIKVIKTGLGIVKSLNLGIDEMAGEYFTQVNSDDILYPSLFERGVNELEKDPSLGFVYTGWIYIDEDDNIIGLPNIQPFNFDRNLLLTGNYIDSVGTFIPKKVLMDVGKFDDRVKIWFDWLMVVKIASKYPVKYIEKPLFYYRRYNDPVRYDSYSKEFPLAKKIVDEELK